MSKAFKRRVVIAGLVALVGAAIIYSRPRHEPEYMGRPLSHWVRRLVAGSGQDTSNAEAALRAAGTNAVPFLVEWLQEAPPGKLGVVWSRLLWKVNQNLYIDHAPGFLRIGSDKALRMLGLEAKTAI